MENNSKIAGYLLGLISILTLVINWGVDGYPALQNDPATTRLWMPFKRIQDLLSACSR